MFISLKIHDPRNSSNISSKLQMWGNNIIHTYCWLCHNQCTFSRFHPFRHKWHWHCTQTHDLPQVPFAHQLFDFPLKHLYIIRITSIGCSIWNNSSRKKSIWCPRWMGGNPLGIFLGNTSSNSWNEEAANLGGVG